MIVGSLVVFALVFGAVVFAAAWTVQKAVSRLVHVRHVELEEIQDTEDIPHAWREPYQRKHSDLEGESGSSDQAAALAAKATRRYLKRLERLRHYVETTRLVDREETRQLLLEQLARVRASVEQSQHV